MLKKKSVEEKKKLALDLSFGWGRELKGNQNGFWNESHDQSDYYFPYSLRFLFNTQYALSLHGN